MIAVNIANSTDSNVSNNIATVVKGDASLWHRLHESEEHMNNLCASSVSVKQDMLHT